MRLLILCIFLSSASTLNSCGGIALVPMNPRHTSYRVSLSPSGTETCICNEELINETDVQSDVGEPDKY